ncbi:MAG: ARPP-1 family domain-containing protein, partial [Candidatus Binatia bacterium]
MPIRIDYESPTVRGALTLFPVFRDEPPIQDYVTGPEAAEKSLFNVSERGDGAVVPELVVTNRADLPLLLIEGEVLVGARQNRTLNVTVLC